MARHNLLDIVKSSFSRLLPRPLKEGGFYREDLHCQLTGKKFRKAWLYIASSQQSRFKRLAEYRQF